VASPSSISGQSDRNTVRYYFGWPFSLKPPRRLPVSSEPPIGRESGPSHQKPPCPFALLRNACQPGVCSSSRTEFISFEARRAIAAHAEAAGAASRLFTSTFASGNSSRKSGDGTVVVHMPWMRRLWRINLARLRARVMPTWASGVPLQPVAAAFVDRALVRKQAFLPAGQETVSNSRPLRNAAS